MGPDMTFNQIILNHQKQVLRANSRVIQKTRARPEEKLAATLDEEAQPSQGDRKGQPGVMWYHRNVRIANIYTVETASDTIAP